jgi:hypothetical protein
LPKLTLSKSIEVRKLNLRTGLPEAGPEVTIPFGAFIQSVETDRDTAKFRYLGERYACRAGVLTDALDTGALAPEPHPAPAAQPAEPAAPAPVPAPAPAKLRWEQLDSGGTALQRAKVPGGWLLLAPGAGLAFYPDPRHRWDGSSLA